MTHTSILVAPIHPSHHIGPWTLHPNQLLQQQHLLLDTIAGEEADIENEVELDWVGGSSEDKAGPVQRADEIQMGLEMGEEDCCKEEQHVFMAAPVVVPAEPAHPGCCRGSGRGHGRGRGCVAAAEGGAAGAVDSGAAGPEKPG